MDIALCPDIYTPGVSEDGIYVDIVPSHVPKNGLKCPCLERFYATRERFAQHIKCKRHELWMQQINQESKNYFRKCIEHEHTIRQQRILIAEMQRRFDTPRVENLIDLEIDD